MLLVVINYKEHDSSVFVHPFILTKSLTSNILWYDIENLWQNYVFHSLVKILPACDITFVHLLIVCFMERAANIIYTNTTGAIRYC